jgi:hypothetical protein
VGENTRRLLTFRAKGQKSAKNAQRKEVVSDKNV